MSLFTFRDEPAPEPATPVTTAELVTAAEMARGFASAWDSATMHIFHSWTDGDLYRAIAGEPAGPGQGAAILEYVAELKRRREATAKQADLEAALNLEHGLA